MKINILILAALTACTAQPQAEQNPTKDSNSVESDTIKVSNNTFEEADAAFQWEANQKLEQLLNFYGASLPDYFGGGFIGETGNLIINIKGDLEAGKASVSRIISVDNIEFRTSKHSLQELNALMEIITRSFDNPSKKIYTSNIMSAGVFENYGYVEVGLKDNSAEKQKEFRVNIVDSPFLKFVESGPLILQ